MAALLPTIVPIILESTETKVIQEEVEKEKGAEFDLDSDDEDEEVMIGLDLEGIDEQVSAIHCLGTLFLECSTTMYPYLEQICTQFKKIGKYTHENVRYHVCLSYT